MLWHLFRRFRLRLGLFLLLLAALSVPLGLWINGANRQARVVRWIGANTGEAWFLGQVDEDGEWKKEEPNLVRDWFEKVLGRDMVRPVERVVLLNPRGEDSVRPGEPDVITPEELAGLEGLPALRFLELSVPGVDDRHLAVIGRFRSLEGLCVSLQDATPEGLEGLRSLENLRALEFELPGIGNRHLSAIAGMKRLERLVFRTYDSKDFDLGPLKGLTRLTRLEVESTAWPGAGLEILPEFARLNSLDLSETEVGDRALEWVAKCEGLETLRLGPNITDDGLERISPLPRLGRLELVASDVTIDGLRLFLDHCASRAHHPASAPFVIVLEDTPISAEEVDGLRSEYPTAEFWTVWSFR